MYKCLKFKIGSEYGFFEAYDPSIVNITETDFSLRHTIREEIKNENPIYGDYTEMPIGLLGEFEKALKELSTSDVGVVELKISMPCWKRHVNRK